LVHKLNLLRIFCIKCVILSQILIKCIDPFTLEIDGVDQKHEGQRIDLLFYDLIDQTVGIVFDPSVDRF
jgi:hypothetical protein